MKKESSPGHWKYDPGRKKSSGSEDWFDISTFWIWSKCYTILAPIRRNFGSALERQTVQYAQEKHSDRLCFFCSWFSSVRQRGSLTHVPIKFIDEDGVLFKNPSWAQWKHKTRILRLFRNRNMEIVSAKLRISGVLFPSV